MGFPSDPDPTGNDCLCCWDAGKTPSQVYISFTGIKICDKPYDGIPYPMNRGVPIPQDPVFPCYFILYPDPWQFVSRFCIDGTTVCSQSWVPKEFFLSHEIGNCEILFDNELDCAGPPIYGHEGNAIVAWNTGPDDHSVGRIFSLINMEPHPDTKFELWPASNARMCVRFARKSDATNILMLIEPAEL